MVDKKKIDEALKVLIDNGVKTVESAKLAISLPDYHTVLKIYTAKEKNELFLQTLDELAAQGSITPKSAGVEILKSWYDSLVDLWVARDMKEIEGNVEEARNRKLSETEFMRIERELRSCYLQDPPNYHQAKNHLLINVFEVKFDSIEDKVMSEICDFREYLLGLSGEKILDNAYRYVSQEDIAASLIYAVNHEEISETAKGTLMVTENLLEKIYNIYIHSDIDFDGAVELFIQEELPKEEAFPIPTDRLITERPKASKEEIHM